MNRTDRMKIFTKGALLASAAVLTLGFVAANHDEHLCSGFLPENTMKIPVGGIHPWSLTTPRAGITETQFNNVIDRFERLYRDEFSQKGGRLKVQRNWSDSTVNAYANRSGSDWVVNMFGGLARHPAVTPDGFALVICHEGGHHIGGAPKGADWFGRAGWATNEGGADYFATLKCLRKFFAEDDNEAVLDKAQIDPLAQTRCASEFTSRADQLICLRTSMALTSVSLLFMDLHKDKTPPNFATPDPAQVAQMDDDHPATQCRMDTYFNGATCHVDPTVPVSDSSYREGSCIQGVDPVGWRPRCWFKP